MQIAIITGEASGDRVGGQLAREIRSLRPDWEIWGVGGQFLRDAGVEIFLDSSRWGVVGIASALRLMPQILAARARLMREMRRRKPDVLVAVDAGALHLGFAGLKGLTFWTRENLPATRILYYFPPGSWRRTLKTTSLARAADLVATPFPWSETELRRLGVDAHFVGHPLLDLVRPEEPVETFAEHYQIDRERPVVGILPGSRAQEIAELLPIQLRAAAIIHQRVPGVQFVIALAPTVDRETIVREIEKLHREQEIENAREAAKKRDEPPPPDTKISIPVPAEGGRMGDGAELARRQKEWMKRATETPPRRHGPLSIAIVENATYDVMATSDVLLATSGTATLEAAILGKPMVISYRMGQSNWLEYQLVKNKIPAMIGMPNILAERMICPELIQDAATPDALASEVIGLLLEPDRLLRMRADLQKAVALLGKPGGAIRTAQMAVDLAEGNTREQPHTSDGTKN